MTLGLIAVGYFIIINIISFAMYGIDKKLAKNHAWRISEAALISVAVIGGSVGAIIGMYVFHHKTRHMKFVIGIPVIIAIQAALLIWLIFFSGISVRLL